MTLAVNEPSVEGDLVFRRTLLCFDVGMAENVRRVGAFLGKAINEAGVWHGGVSNRSCLRGVALELRHLERFIAVARLDLSKARPPISCLVGLISAALKRSVGEPGRTSAFRETFLMRLPKKAQRAARSLGVRLQGVKGEAVEERESGRALQAVIAELGFLGAYLRDLAQDSEVCMDSGAEGRLGRFAGRMADRVEYLARSIEDHREARS